MNINNYYYKLESYFDDTLTTILVKRHLEWKWYMSVHKNGKLIHDGVSNQSIHKLKLALSKEYGMQHCKWQRLQ